MIRYIIRFVGFTGLALAGLSCSENISECPTQMCVMAGGWQLTEVEIDDEKSTEDFSQYRLILNDPSPTDATISVFERTTSQGVQEDGSWSLTNYDPKKGLTGASLRLVPENDNNRTEDWVIERLTPRELILVLTRDTGAKEGPGKIRFVLVPF